MGNCCSRDTLLDIEKDINIKLETTIASGYMQRDRQNILRYVRDIIENEGCGFSTYISHYIEVFDIEYKNDPYLVFNLKLRIIKAGKNIDAKKNIHYINEKKLSNDELKKLCSVAEMKSHVGWSLDTAAFRGEPLTVSGETYFTIKYGNIKYIHVSQ
tara:strand:- start:101 stop:571 length:471 start_codon:yes stop_codon:yes gene_type:complete